VRGQAFRQWLRFRYFEKTRAGVNSDALAFCRLATGGGTGKRKLYTDDDEILFAGRRPICLNGIEALAGVMWDVTSDYDVPLMVSRGMPSITFLHGSALAIRAAAQRGKDAYIYQFGDHDPSGVLIPRSLERRLNEMCEKLDCPPPTVERRALTEKQIQQHRLPTRPTKRDGNRHAHGFEGDSVELDALPPRVLRSMVRDVIERHISPEATEVLRAAEDSERELLRAWRRTPKKA
jgi:hypothetical protein